MSKERPEYEKRVIEEHEQLVNKLEALKTYAGKGYPGCTQNQQVLLKKQLVLMSSYAEILSDRIKDFDSEEALPETLGNKIVGSFNPGNNSDVETIKGLTTVLIDFVEKVGKDPRRIAAAATQFEYAQMMAVKSLF